MPFDPKTYSTLVTADDLNRAEIGIQTAQAGVEGLESSTAKKARLVVNVKDFGATGDGTTDDSAAIQAAINSIPADSASSLGACLYFPAGIYKKYGTTSRSGVYGLHITGDGPGSFILQMTDSDVFSIVTSGVFKIDNLSIQARNGAAMTTGAVVRLSATSGNVQLDAQDIGVGQALSSEFKYIFHITNPYETFIKNVVGSGIGGITHTYMTTSATGTGARGPHKFVKCELYNGLYGLDILNTTSPGIEGVQTFGCDWVGVVDGVRAINTFADAPTYFPPQLQIVGGHMNASRRCVDVSKWAQVEIGGLLYNSGTNEFIRLSDVSIFELDFMGVVTGAGNPDGVLFQAPTSNCGLGSMHDCEIAFLSGSTKYAVVIDNLVTTKIHHNRASLASGFARVVGTLSSTVELLENTPLDSADTYEAVSITGGNTIALPGLRSDVVYVNAPGGATTVTTIVHRKDNELVHLLFDSTLITIQHNAGCILKGGVNFVAGSATNLTLKRTAGIWREVGRTA